jgi:uncharacterized repeat protein (TIGR03837 family)
MPVARLPEAATATHSLHWDVFCRRVDNLGDVGVAWRLAADLAGRGEQVRLWLDDPSPLAFMAPAGHAGVACHRWPSEPAAWPKPGDAVIEMFGCHLPDAFIQAMARRQPAPVWLNLEYLSAEFSARSNHGLPSPQPCGVPKWFFYPGWLAGTGGLPREPDLMQRQADFDAQSWLAARGIQRQAGTRVVLLFCYEGAQLEALRPVLGQGPCELMLTPGPAQALWAEQAAGEWPGVRTTALPWLSQLDFDHALWSTDFNVVRGEDSWVRAFWAGVPFVWQPYPQTVAVRYEKLQAWLAWLEAATRQAGVPGDTPATSRVPDPARLPDACRALHERFDGPLAAFAGHETPAEMAPALLDEDIRRWRQALRQARDSMLGQADLTTQLKAFVAHQR